MTISEKASIRTTAPQQDEAGGYPAARAAGRQQAASAAAREGRATREQFAKAGAKTR